MKELSEHFKIIEQGAGDFDAYEVARPAAEAITLAAEQAVHRRNVCLACIITHSIARFPPAVYHGWSGLGSATI
ncbi:hypothetical protein E5358_11265 [Palleniella muris]|uniref:Uncharacterized protein n=1 Tax=Palleniella muris TaxID=3038145 RepID=A0AC61QNF4_9BACT|nr:hypothetical protein [Palleniella muris]TGX81187.1 hypothetical protein E5358_11265 [Palleniella muris]